MFPGTKKRNEGTLGCSPVPKPRMRAHSPKPPFYETGETALLFPLEMFHEDVNGEKLTVKKWWIFGADFSRFTQSFSRCIRDINSEKIISLLMIFFTVSFSRFTPSRKFSQLRKRAILKPIRFLLKRHSNGYQHERVPKFLVLTRNLPFCKPFVLIPFRWC